MNKHIVVPEKLHRELKIEAARKGMKLKDYITQKLRKGKHEKETLKW